MFVTIEPEPKDITDEEAQKYIDEHKNYYEELRDNMEFEEYYSDHPLPFVDFPEPINQYIARLEILEKRTMDENAYKSDEQIDEECWDEDISIEAFKAVSRGEADILNKLTSESNISVWEVFFYLKVYNNIYEYLYQ